MGNFDDFIAEQDALTRQLNPEAFATTADPSANSHSLGDLVRSIGAGLDELGVLGGKGLGLLGFDQAGQHVQDLYRAREKQQAENMTPASQESLQKKILATDEQGNVTGLGEALTDPWAIAHMAARSIPSMALGMGGGMMATRGLIGAGMSPGVAGVIGGGIGEGGVAGVTAASQIYDEIMALPEEKLSTSPEYQTLLQTMDPTSARTELAKSAATRGGLQDAAATFALGGPSGHFTGRIIGGEAKGVLPNMAKSAFLEGLQEVPQSGAEQLITNAQIGRADPSTPIMKDVWESMAQGGIVGPLFGAGEGLTASHATVEPPKTIGQMAEQVAKQSAGQEKPQATTEIVPLTQQGAQPQGVQLPGMENQPVPEAGVAGDSAALMAALRDVKAQQFGRENLQADGGRGPFEAPGADPFAAGVLPQIQAQATPGYDPLAAENDAWMNEPVPPQEGPADVAALEAFRRELAARAVMQPEQELGFPQAQVAQAAPAQTVQPTFDRELEQALNEPVPQQPTLADLKAAEDFRREQAARAVMQPEADFTQPTAPAAPTPVVQPTFDRELEQALNDPIPLQQLTEQAAAMEPAQPEVTVEPLARPSLPTTSVRAEGVVPATDILASPQDRATVLPGEAVAVETPAPTQTLQEPVSAPPAPEPTQTPAKAENAQQTGAPSVTPTAEPQQEVGKVLRVFPTPGGNVEVAKTGSSFTVTMRGEGGAPIQAGESFKSETDAVRAAKRLAQPKPEPAAVQPPAQAAPSLAELEAKLGPDTAGFIRKKVAGLGGVEAVSQRYRNNDAVSRYARAFADQHFAAQAEATSEAPQPAEVEAAPQVEPKPVATQPAEAVQEEPAPQPTGDGGGAAGAEVAKAKPKPQKVSKEERSLAKMEAEVRQKHLRDLKHRVTDYDGNPREVRITREGPDHVSVKAKDFRGEWVQMPNQSMPAGGSKKDVQRNKFWPDDLARETFQSTHKGQFAGIWPARYTEFHIDSIKRPTAAQMNLTKSVLPSWMAIEAKGEKGWSDGRMADFGNLLYKEDPKNYLLDNDPEPKDFTRIIGRVSYSDPKLTPRFIQQGGDGGTVIFSVDGESRLVSAPIRDFAYFVSKYGKGEITLHQRSAEEPIGVVKAGEIDPVGVFMPFKQPPDRPLDLAEIRRQIQEDSAGKDGKAVREADEQEQPAGARQEEEAATQEAQPEQEPVVATEGREKPMLRPGDKSEDFVSAPDGGEDYGEVPSSVAATWGGKAGPIRLLPGDKYSGAEHIERRHGDQIRGLGFKGVEDFVNHVVSNFNAVYAGSGRAVILTVRGDRPWKAASIKMEYNPEGDFWSVQSAAPMRPDYFVHKDGLEKKKLLWEGAQANHLLRKKTPSAVSGQSSFSAENSAEKTISPKQDLGKSLTATQVKAALKGTAFEGLTVLDSPEDLTDRQFYRQLEEADQLGAKGAYDPNTGKAYVFAGNNADMADAFVTAAHEGGHEGIGVLRANAARDMGGDVRQGAHAVNNILDAIYAANARKIQKEIALGEYKELDMRDAKDRRRATEEWLMANAPTQTRWYDKYVAAMTRFMRAMAKHLGVQIAWTDTETRDFLAKAYEARQQGGEGVRVLDAEGAVAYRKASPIPTAKQSLADMDELLKDVEITTSAKNDIGLVRTYAALPHWIAKDFPVFSKLYDRQLSRREERSTRVTTSLGEAQSFLDLKGKDLDKARDVIWKIEGKKIEELGKWHEADGKLANGRTKLALREDHYKALEDYIQDELGGSAQVAKAVADVRRALDSIYVETFNRFSGMAEADDGEIAKMRQSLGKIDNYFPHMREGDFYVRAVSKTEKDENGQPKTLFRQHFDVLGGTKHDRDILSGPRKRRVEEAAKRIILENKDSYPADAVWEFDDVKNLPETVFQYPIPVEAMDQVLKAVVAKLPEDVRGDASKLMAKGFSDELKARGAGQHFIARKGTPGFETQDVQKIFFDHVSSMHGFLTKMDAARDFTKYMYDFDAKAEPKLYNYGLRYMQDMLQNSDKIDRAVGLLKSIGFAKYLGFRVATAAVNLTQNIISGIPTLGMHTDKAGRYYWSALADITALAKHSLTGKLDKLKGVTDDESKLLHELYAAGDTRAQFMEDTRLQVMGNPATKVWAKMLGVAGWPMEVSERFNRASLALAAYRAARAGHVDKAETLSQFHVNPGQKFGHDNAVKFARMIVNDAHFVYDKGNMPQPLRGSAGGKMLSSAYQFRRFTHNMVGLWAHMWKSGDRGKKALARSFAGLIGLGGLAAVPLYKTVMAAIMGASGDDGEEWLRRKVGGGLAGDLLIYGFPSLGGVQLAGSIGMDLPVVSEMGGKKFGNPVWDLVGIPGAFIKESGQSLAALSAGNIGRAIAMSPITPSIVRNTMEAHRMSTEGAFTQSGRPIPKLGEHGPMKLTTAQAIAKVLGFSPVELAKNYSMAASIDAQNQFRQDVQKKFADNYANAKRRNDLDEMREIRAQVKEWNAQAIKDRKRHLVIDLATAVRSRQKEFAPPKRMSGRVREMQEVY